MADIQGASEGNQWAYDVDSRTFFIKGTRFERRIIMRTNKNNVRIEYTTVLLIVSRHGEKD